MNHRPEIPSGSIVRDIGANAKKMLKMHREGGPRNQTAQFVAFTNRLAHRKPTRDVFVLGSGASVASLTSDHFAHIGRGISIGLNLWPLHPFVPDIFYFEGCADPEGRRLWREHLSAKAPLLAGSIFAAPLGLFEANHSAEDLELLNELFDGRVLRPQIFHAVARTPAMLGLLIALQRRGVWQRQLFHFRSSLVAAIDLARRIHGVTRIILVGIDLNSTGYFWHERGLDYLHAGAADVHPTARRSHGYLSVMDYLAAFIEAVPLNERPELLVASRESALAGMLPIWEHAPTSAGGVVSGLQ